MDFQSCSPSISYRISNVVHGGRVDIFWNSPLKLAGDMLQVAISPATCGSFKKSMQSLQKVESSFTAGQFSFQLLSQRWRKQIIANGKRVESSTQKITFHFSKAILY